MYRLLFSLCLWMASAVYCQTPPEPRFEVASVKPASGDIFSTRVQRSGGRLSWTTQLCYLIGYAYNLDCSLVSCSKLGSIYSVEATFDPSATDRQVRLMMQSLLADRFQMRAHKAAKQASGYGLVIGKNGAKLKEAKAEEEPSGAPSEGFISASTPEVDVIAITGRNVALSQLAETLQRLTGTPVWDRTGLTARYDFAFRFTQGLIPDSKADAPFLASALQENLGLKLEKQQGRVESLVVDSIAEPSGNEQRD